MENGKKDVQAQADLPKKNAAPAEAPKSLGATIQNVITKAVTSPTDGKIDFAQGVNHITGDPQQIDLKFPNDSAIHEVPKVKESKYAYAVNLVDNHRHEALDEILRLLQQYA